MYGDDLNQTIIFGMHIRIDSVISVFGIFMAKCHFC